MGLVHPRSLKQRVVKMYLEERMVGRRIKDQLKSEFIDVSLQSIYEWVRLAGGKVRQRGRSGAYARGIAALNLMQEEGLGQKRAGKAVGASYKTIVKIRREMDEEG